MPVEVVRTELRDDGAADVVVRLNNAGKLCAIEMAEDGLEPILLDGLDLIEGLGSAGRDADKDDASVVRHPDTFDETPLLHPIDDTGGIAERHVQQVGHPAHRQVAVVLEHPQDVHVRHADAKLHETTRAGASESTDDLVKAIDDAPDHFGRGIRGCDGIDRIDSSHDMNNLSPGNHRVNRNDCCR
jgi:hypothetical protein